MGIYEGYEDIINLHNLIDEQLYKIKLIEIIIFPHILLCIE